MVPAHASPDEPGGEAVGAVSLGEATNRRASAGARFSDALSAMAGARGPGKRALGWALVLGAAAEYEFWRMKERAWERWVWKGEVG